MTTPTGGHRVVEACATGAAEAPTKPPEEVEVPEIGEEGLEEVTAQSLFDPAATARIVTLWILAPVLSVVDSYLLFAFVL